MASLGYPVSKRGGRKSGEKRLEDRNIYSKISGLATWDYELFHCLQLLILLSAYYLWNKGF